MRSNLTLRTRFLLATSIIVVSLCIAFGVTVHQFIEILEDQMLHKTLTREMQEFAQDFANDATVKPPSAGGLKGYVVRDGQVADTLPPQLIALSPGLHEDVLIDGDRDYVARRDVLGARLYLVLNTEHVEAIEQDVTTVAVVGGVVALALAGLIATLLSRAVMRPVTALANEVTSLDPRSRDTRLREQFADREVGIIANAFDDYLARLDSVLEREHSFTEDASHELRTPLAIVASATQLLAEEPQLSDQGRERVARIRRACGQMQSLIEALLFLAREDSASARSCDLDEIVREAADTARTVAADKKVAFEVQTEPVSVLATPGMVACVVNNLLLNAVNFTQEGLIEVKLTQAELTVRDTGVGIAPTELSHIFERRYRGPQSRGLGLGLYLVSRICERLGWHVAADSTEGAGTRFTITFAPEVRT